MVRLCVGDGICARICVRVCVEVGIGDEAGALSLILTLIHSGSGMLNCDGHIYGKGFFGWIGDSGGGIGVDLRERAQEQAADVRENGGAARRDAVLGQEFVEVLERMVDTLGGLEALKIADELEAVIGGLLLDLFGEMLSAEAGVRVGNGKTAAAAGVRAIGAAGG